MTSKDQGDVVHIESGEQERETCMRHLTLRAPPPVHPTRTHSHVPIGYFDPEGLLTLTRSLSHDVLPAVATEASSASSISETPQTSSEEEDTGEEPFNFENIVKYYVRR